MQHKRRHCVRIARFNSTDICCDCKTSTAYTLYIGSRACMHAISINVNFAYVSMIRSLSLFYWENNLWVTNWMMLISLNHFLQSQYKYTSRNCQRLQLLSLSLEMERKGMWDIEWFSCCIRSEFLPKSKF